MVAKPFRLLSATFHQPVTLPSLRYSPVAPLVASATTAASAQTVATSTLTAIDAAIKDIGEKR